jgi:hypothetical protein
MTQPLGGVAVRVDDCPENIVAGLAATPVGTAGGIHKKDMDMQSKAPTWLVWADAVSASRKTVIEVPVAVTSPEKAVHPSAMLRAETVCSAAAKSVPPLVSHFTVT